MPQIGQDITVGTVVRWLKKEGDPVRRGEIVATVESEKASFDVEADADGTFLKALCPEGEEADVLTPIGYIGEAGETMPPAAAPPAASALSAPSAPASPSAQGAPVSATVPSSAGGRRFSSPSARRVAREHGVSLDGMAGTGPGGRIIKRDVLAARHTVPSNASDLVIPFDGIRKHIADRLSLASRTIPHFFLQDDFDMEGALAWRQAYNARHSCHVTITDLALWAVSRTLAGFPRLNAHVAEDRLTVKARINLGFAVSTDAGLFVPVVTDADHLDPAALSVKTRALAEEARAGRFAPGAPGTFTITSLGMHGVPRFLPIINPPECAILSLGASTLRPVAVQGRVEIRQTMSVTLACDHRAVDGAYAAAFLARLKAHVASLTEETDS